MTGEQGAGDGAVTDRVDTRIAVMVVGTPRSGTTLLQRLVAEHTGLPTVPETHMFTVFAPRLLRRARFPLAGDELREALTAYVSMQQHRGGGPSAEAVFDRLGGSARSMAELFVAVVAELAGGAERVVEKTPDHLLWVRHLAGVFPDTQFVAVVRDPRAVHASNTGTHWGQRNAVIAAERWKRDQRLLANLADTLASNRLLVLRYEDLVTDEATQVGLLRRFVAEHPSSDEPGGAKDRPAGTPDRSDVFRDHELAWKGRATGPVTDDRVEAWKDSLPPESVAAIEAVCWSVMQSFGYQPVAEVKPRLSPADMGHRLLYQIRRVGHERRIRHSYAPRAGLR